MILTLDTTTKNFSIAIGTDDGKLIKEIFIPDTEFTHSELIIKNFDILLKKTKTSLKDIKKIICTSGPGTWTGIRVGLSFTRTLAQILRIPVVTISGLDILAYKKSQEVKNNKCIIYATIPSQLDEVYIALYKHDKKRIKRISEYTILTQKEIEHFLNRYNKEKLEIFSTNHDKIFSAKDLLNFAKKKGNHFSQTKPLYIKLPRIYKK